MIRDHTDAELLQRYADQGCEDAFAEIVRRHLNLVYGCALRRVGGDAHLAKDVAQQVFSALAQRAAALSSRDSVSGWLFTTTRFIAAQVARTERRRHVREQEAHTMNEVDATPQPDWERLRPVLDEAIEELGERDRDAVLLRFFEGRSFPEIGTRLRLTESAARMRVERALDKMHALLSRRGVNSTTAALALALSGHAGATAPAGLAASVTTAVLAGGAGAGVVSAGAVTGTFMSMTNLQLGLSGILACAATTAYVVQAGTNSDLHREVAKLRKQNAALAPLQAENLRLARTAAEVAEMRHDDAELARLQEEAAELRTTLQRIARASEARAAAASTEPLPPSDRLPVAKLQLRPPYPAEMRKAGIPGVVLVSFVVDGKGDVKNVSARRSSQREFEAAAVESVSGWKFDPGQKANRAVSTRMQVPIVFKVQGVEGPPMLPFGEGLPAGTIVTDGPTDAAAVILEPFTVMAEQGATAGKG